MKMINQKSSAKVFAVSLFVLATVTATMQPARADLGGTVGAATSAPDGMITRDLSVEQRPVAQVPVPASELKINAWVNAKDNTYKPGEMLELMVDVNKDAYVTVIDIGTSGKVHIVFPNEFQKDNRVAAGKPVKIPSGSDNFQFKVGGPAGSEVLKVIATTGNVPLFPQKNLTKAGPFLAYKGDGKAAAKDLEVVIRENLSGNQWAEYTKVVKIVDGAPAAQPPAPPAPPAPAAAPSLPPVAVGGPVMPSAVAVVPAAPAPGSGFKLSVATDKPVYKVGENAVVSAVSERDCKLTLVNVGSSGKVHILYPNQYQPDNQLKAGQAVTIPSAAAPVDFRVMGPDGLEALIAICRADDKPVLSGTVNYQQQGAFPAYGDAKTLAKDLAVTLREPSSAIAHAATSFLVAK